ncbi:NPCBM/NEW2 domain-containing protein [Micromonospora sp. C28ISP2-4]|uniref:NPCBM/NEW2 domain-containing protein n=1 Tax=Micromonospora sp. C28ISP2-4 TaxID=3059523 RepID=UPI0026766825|nr:NPCBM/NEW2 domain-containing protein [Micromonospora sp. C28ISP2-4]MDO3685775.1 NPCBM/NEW2 domain-containing protein [Micromonospora sp. C28ISP2-4]
MRTDSDTATPPQATAPRPARLLPQGVGVVADVAAVAALLAGGGRPIVLAASAGAVLTGGYLLVRRLGQPVDRTALVGLAVAVAGAAIFGYALRPAPAPATPAGAAPTTAAAPATGTPVAATTGASAAAGGDSSSPGAAGTWLYDLPPVDGGNGWEQRAETVDGKRYDHSLVASTCTATDDESESFNLGRRFAGFRATVGVPDDVPDSFRARFTVLVDGEVVFRRDLGLGGTAALDVPVTGALRLTLQVDNVGQGGCDNGVWIEPRLR